MNTRNAKDKEIERLRAEAMPLIVNQSKLSGLVDELMKEIEQLKGKLQQVAFLVADWANLCVEGSLDAHKLEKIQAAMRD